MSKSVEYFNRINGIAEHLVHSKLHIPDFNIHSQMADKTESYVSSRPIEFLVTGVLGVSNNSNAALGRGVLDMFQINTYKDMIQAMAQVAMDCDVMDAIREIEKNRGIKVLTSLGSVGERRAED